MPNKKFAERLNRELDNIDVPSHSEERIEVFSKLIKIPKFKAEALINGITLPIPTLLVRLANEFEVNPDWLLGRSDERQS